MNRWACLLLWAAALAAQTPEDHLRTGVKLREEGKLAEAITEFSAALRLRPGFEQARLALALARQQAGDLDRAAAEYRELLRRNPKSADGHNWYGVLQMQKNDLPAALAEFRKAVALRPAFARAWNNLGSTLGQTGDIPAAVEAFRKAVALEPRETPYRVNLGIALRNNGDAEGAIAEFKTALARTPDNPDLHVQMGQALKQSGDIGAAIGEYETALKFDPELREAYYGLGEALKQQASATRRARPVANDPRLKAATDALAAGNLPSARQQVKAFLAVAPDSAEAYHLLGFVQGQEGDLPASVESLERAVQLKPDLAEAHYSLGVALWYSGARDRSLASLEEAVRLNPAAGEAYAFLGMANRELARQDQARRDLQRALAVSPNLPGPYVDLALLFLRAGRVEHGFGQLEAVLNLPDPAGRIPDLDVVIGEIRRAMERMPGDAAAHILLGRFLGLKGADPKEVIAEFREAVRLKPGSAEAHNNLGLVLSQTGEEDQAIAEFREAVRAQPRYAAAHGNLGAALLASHIDEAIRELETAISLQPRLVRAQFNLALAYGQSPKHGPDQQIVQLRKVIELEPAFAVAHYELGKALFRKGPLLDAVKELREAVRLDPELSAARYQLGLALTRAGQKEEGAAELEKARQSVSEDRRLETTAQLMDEARAALKRGDREAAIGGFRNVTRLSPGYAGGHAALASALQDRGNIAEAAAEYRKTRELEPASFDAALGLSQALAASGDLAGSEAAARDALRLRPSSEEARKQLDRLSSAGPPPQGMTHASALRRPDREPPKTPAAYATIAAPDDPAKVALFESYIREGRFREVEPLLNNYIKANPHSWWAYYVLGYALYGQHRITDSVNALAMSLQMNLNNAEAHKVLGRNFMLIGRFDAATIEMEQAAKLSPQSAEIRYNLGKICSAQDAYPEARRHLQAALQLDPQYMEAFDALGFVLESLGEDDAAVAAYQKAAALNAERNASFAGPYINLSAFYNRTGDPDKAAQWARQALAVSPQADGAWFQLGKALDRKQQWADAVDALGNAIALNSHASSYYYVLGNAYRRLGKIKESREALAAFQRLERESAEFDQKRRDAKRTEPVKQ